LLSILRLKVTHKFVTKLLNVFVFRIEQQKFLNIILTFYVNIAAFSYFFDFNFLTEGGADMWLTPPPQNAVGVTADF